MVARFVAQIGQRVDSGSGAFCTSPKLDIVSGKINKGQMSLCCLRLCERGLYRLKTEPVLIQDRTSPLDLKTGSTYKHSTHIYMWTYNNNNSNNKYISKALNPSVSNQPEAQSAVHVQSKLNKLHHSIKTKQTKKPATSKNKKNPSKQTKAGAWIVG